MSSRVTYAAAVAWAWLGSSAAEACPYCAGRDGEQAFGSIALLGLAILAPFAVAGIVGWAIRRLANEDEDPVEATLSDDSLRGTPNGEIATDHGPHDVRSDSSQGVTDTAIAAEDGPRDARGARGDSSPGGADAAIVADDGLRGARDVQVDSSPTVASSRALADVALGHRPMVGRVADADRTNEAIVVEPAP